MKALFASLCAVPPHPSPLWSEYSSIYLDSCLPHVLGRLGWSTRFFTSSTVGYQPRLGFEKSYGRVELATFQLDQQKKMRNKNSKSNSTLDISLWQGQKRFGRANFLGFDERIMNLPIASWLRRLKQEQQRKPAFGVISRVTTHAPYTTTANRGLELRPASGGAPTCDSVVGTRGARWRPRISAQRSGPRTPTLEEAAWMW